jgi:hypothetical protein
LAANGLTLPQALAGLGFGAVALLLAGAWQWTLRRAESAAPPTGRQRARDVAVFLAVLAALGALAWWFTAGPRR